MKSAALPSRVRARNDSPADSAKVNGTPHAPDRHRTKRAGKSSGTQAVSTGAAERSRLTHHVYVVELDAAVLVERKFRARNPTYREGRPCVYVGMTGLSPEARFENHKRGHKANRFVTRYGLRLLPEHYACFNPMPHDTAAEMEVGLAEDLRRIGYAVWQG